VPAYENWGKVEKMHTKIALADITTLVGGRLVLGDGAESTDAIVGTCSIDNYVPSKVAFAGSDRYVKAADSLSKATIIISDDLFPSVRTNNQNTLIVVPNALLAMTLLQREFYGERLKSATANFPETNQQKRWADSGVKVHPAAAIAHDAEIGSDVIIHSGVTIFGDVSIGSGTVIMPNTTIYPGTKIGRSCVIHAGTTLGADGFRFEQFEHSVEKFEHAGSVSVGHDVEIGANCTVDRATFEDEASTLGDGVKLDNQVHIGHNAKIGAHTMIAAQTCISGSVVIGQKTWIGAGVTVSNGVTIGDNAQILINAVVVSEVLDGSRVSGFYSMPHRAWKRLNAMWRNQLK